MTPVLPNLLTKHHNTINLLENVVWRNSSCTFVRFMNTEHLGTQHKLTLTWGYVLFFTQWALQVRMWYKVNFSAVQLKFSFSLSRLLALPRLKNPVSPFSWALAQSEMLTILTPTMTHYTTHFCSNKFGFFG